MSSSRHVFSIAQKINSVTGQPFGDHYCGTFTIRRPSIGDKKRIEIKDAASMAEFGRVNPDSLTDGMKLLSWAFSTMAIIGEEVPKWFDIDKLFEPSDEVAVLSVWEEVADWFATFRKG